MRTHTHAIALRMVERIHAHEVPPSSPDPAKSWCLSSAMRRNLYSERTSPAPLKRVHDVVLRSKDSIPRVGRMQGRGGMEVHDDSDLSFLDGRTTT